ncbi:MAG: pantetheine-phosphate adenylyltransferase [Planctomycetes bacterium]|nr:pantetheine-phosphate adenylyltransferase [Planctomycetota bacterium]
MTEAIYPGSFDPVTNGHLDLIERGSRLFSRLIVAVARNVDKAPLFSSEERVAMLREQVAGRFANVEVTSFAGLIVEYARQSGVHCLLRGLRTIADFEYEFQMALTNRRLAPDIETVFVMPSLRYSYVSARLIRETVLLGADMSHLIPASVQTKLRARLSTAREGKGGGAP